MGTHGTVIFKENVESLLSVLHTDDGNPKGIGLDLAKWLKDKKVVNGYTSLQNKNSGYANGIGCLAAQYIADFKKDIGRIYITNLHEICKYKYIVELDIFNNLVIIFNDVVFTPEEFIEKVQGW